MQFKIRKRVEGGRIESMHFKVHEIMMLINVLKYNTKEEVMDVM